MAGFRWGPAAAGLVLAGLWEALAAGHAGIATPLAAGARLAGLLAAPGFEADMAVTGWAFVLSVAIALPCGAALGAVLGMGRLAAAVSEPILVNLYALPKVTLYPLVLLVFGLGLPAKVAFGVMHGLIPLALTTLGAVRRVDPVLLRTARIARLTRWQALAWVILPAILPELVAGARLAVSLSLLGVLIGEMFASSHGVGHRAMAAMESGDMPAALGIAVLLAGFALAVNAAVGRLGRLV